MKIVEIFWGDAHVDTDSTDIKKAATIKPILTRTIGYLMAENDDGIVVASDCYPNMPKEGGIINFVPWGMVVKYYWYDVEED